MGDLPPGTAPQSLDITAAGLAHDEYQGSSFRSPTNNAPFYSQLSSISPGQPRPDIRSPTSSQYSSQDHGASSLNMGAMGGALPEHSNEIGRANTQNHHQSQRPISGASTSALAYQLGQNLQMHGHASGSLQAHSPYGPGFAPGQYQQNFAQSPGAQANYAPFNPNQHRLPGANPIQAPYQNFHQPSQFLYYPSPYGPQGQFPQGFPQQAAQTQALFGRRPSLPNAQGQIPGQGMELPQQEAGYPQGGRIMPGAVHGDLGTVGSVLSGTFGAPTGMQRAGPVSSVPRGPPRKPKQSGHALWVGNLPPGTTVTALKDHFSRDATKDIESLFLISKSNCAFVNYRTEASCTAAMHRFHDSRFNGVRLVCRLRRSSAPASGVPTGPSAMLGSVTSGASPPQSPKEAERIDGPVERVESPAKQTTDEARPTSNASERYFIVKSLTLQDLESSVRNGIWATQSHNEDVLNKAYQSAEHVYLIFSANKSGEYFGYARMTSPILEDAKDVVAMAPKPNTPEAADSPKAIPTPATEFAPKGRIIDDSARGTIFWEAETSDSDIEEGEKDKEEPQPEGDAPGMAQSWGKPFKVEWISTNRLPFYRTRGLRNPWNANREVKIARDGTELETSVGERLVQMFHRLGPSGAATSMTMSAPMMQPPPLPQLGGPPMRFY